MRSLKERVKKLADDYQEVLFWMPPAIALVFLAFHYFPQIDPRSGIDGLGQMFAMLVNVTGGIMVCFSAWLSKRAYFGMWSDEDQKQLRAFMVSKAMFPSDKYALLAAQLADQFEWILCFAFWYIVVF